MLRDLELTEISFDTFDVLNVRSQCIFGFSGGFLRPLLRGARDGERRNSGDSRSLS